MRSFRRCNETDRHRKVRPIRLNMIAAGKPRKRVKSDTEKQVMTVIMKRCGHHACGIGRRVFGLAQTAVGAGAMAIGLPMLILPGPGLLVLGGGTLIAAGGVKKVLGK